MWRKVFAALLACTLLVGTVSVVGCSGEKKELNLSDSEGK